MVSQQHSFEYKGEKIVIKFPNVGQLIDMESMKQLLTSNRYSAMASANLKSMNFSLNLVDAIVFFQVMCPKIKRLIEIDDYTKLDPMLAKELIEIYQKDIFAPWYYEILKELYSYGDVNTAEQKS